MDIGVALPSAVETASGRELTGWARSAEELGFSTLSVVDRLVWPGYEPLTALAAAAAVTERIRLATQVLLAAARADVGVLAKQAASVHRLSHGRLSLGVAAGVRRDDYELTGTGFHDRGHRLDETLAALRRLWEAGAVTPEFDGPAPEILIGGRSEAALTRMARFGDGTVVVGPPPAFAQRARRALEVWAEHGREGRPRLIVQTYFALGDDAREAARDHVGSYYAFAGPHVGRFVDATLTTEQAVREAVEGYRRAGCDELVLIPCTSRPEQLQLLAAVVKEEL